MSEYPPITVPFEVYLKTKLPLIGVSQKDQRDILEAYLFSLTDISIETLDGFRERRLFPEGNPHRIKAAQLSIMQTAWPYLRKQTREDELGGLLTRYTLFMVRMN